MPVFDPLLAHTTIGDEEDVVFDDVADDEEAIETQPVAPTPQKKTKKKKAKSSTTPSATTTTTLPNKGEELDPSFLFQADGGNLDWVTAAIASGTYGPQSERQSSETGTGLTHQHPWDFSKAKEAIKANTTASAFKTSIDDKIKRAKGSSAGDHVSSDEANGDDDAQSDDSVSETDIETTTHSTGNYKETEESFEGSEEEEEESGADDDEPEDVVNEKRKASFFASEADIMPSQSSKDSEGVESFTSLKLSRPILKGIAAMGFVKPTSIQNRAIPLAMLGKDICGSAVTGSGKTGAFIIPILERLLFRPKHVAATRVLILVPTRELGVQCHSVAMNLAKFTDISFCLAVGGLNTKTQEAELRKRPDVVIATPGRLIDHIHNSMSFHLENIEILVMDEADRMLEDGFAAELDEIIKNTPKSRQTMLFSATMTDNVDQLIKLSLNHPVRLFVDSSQSMASNLVQEFIRIREHREDTRPQMLAALCTRTYTEQVIVFFRSKAAAHNMKIVFGLLGLSAAELHGNLTQLQRLEALEDFRDKKVDFLLATDLASRGIDISGVKTVINYDMPKSYEQYVHRSGRTARASRSGRVVSLVGEADRQVLKLAIKNSRDQVKHRVIPQTVLEKYGRKIEGLQEQIQEIYQAEREEHEMAKAEMEITKASNLVEFEAEIRNRPAKTWFQSEHERQKSKEMSKQKHDADMGVAEETNTVSMKRKWDDIASKNPIKRGKTDGLSRKKKRSAMVRAEDEADMAKQKLVAKSIKAKTRPQRTNVVSDKPLAKKSTTAPAKKKAKAFDAEITTLRGGKAKCGVAVKSANPSSKESAGKGGKGANTKLGKYRGAKSFKSKQKYKRR